MAETLDDGEFWLPSEFLTDDDILMEKTLFHKGGVNTTTTNSEPRFCFPSEFPYGFSCYGSSLNSPDESLVGSTETESDEDEYLTGFTRPMARSLLNQAEINSSSLFSAENPKSRVVAGSPESPLCGIGSWSGCSAGSSRGSPNGPSQVSSPPSTPLNGKDDAWDLLYAAAGQVVRMKLNDEGTKYGRGLLGDPRKPTTTSVSLPLKSSNVGCYSNQALAQQAQHQLQANHFYQLKQQQQQQQQCSAAWGRQVKPIPTPQHQQLPNGGRSVGVGGGGGGGGGVGIGVGGGRCNRTLGLPPSAWPPLQPQPQQQNGSGMRAVFLGGSGGRRESSGTGVFLPRRTGNPSDSRRKPACSTVLLPARVVQALNLSFEDMNGGAPQPRYVGGLGGSLHGNAAFLSQQQKRTSYRPQLPINTEVQLPQEWTY